MKLYDKQNKRLVMFKQKANSEYWDEHWQVNDFIGEVKTGKNNKLVKKFTSRFLRPGTKILEGGCGMGRNVYGLNYWGYDAYGVDFAEKTIEKTKKAFPELKVSVQDVKKLDFPDNFFHGYWSLGVIEHFWEGYDEALKELKRVLRPNGYLFLSFPHMSALRKFKAKRGLYKNHRNTLGPNNFYQFILDKDSVRKDVEQYGFRLVLQHPFDAAKGIKDEISFLKPILQRIYNNQNMLARGIRFLNTFLFSKVAGHMILLIFQKNEE